MLTSYDVYMLFYSCKKLKSYKRVRGFFCDLFKLLSMSVRRSIQRHLVNDNILKKFLSLFSISWSNSLVWRRRRRWGFSYTQQYHIVYFYFQSIITKIIQSALTDPKVINLSNQHFSVFVSSPFQSIHISLSLSFTLCHCHSFSSSFLPINYLLCLNQKTSNDKIY